MNKDPLEPRLQRYLEERADDRPTVGFEDRILGVVKREPRRAPTPSGPRQLVAATAIAVFAVGLAAGVAYIRNHQPAAQGPGPSMSPALSIGTGGGGDWVVVRGIDVGSSAPPDARGNALVHTTDGGDSWQSRLSFAGIYDGMAWSADGRSGVIWTNDMTRPCGTATTCSQPPNQVVTVYSTADRGLHWTQHPSKAFGNFAVVYFRGFDGWVLSEGEMAPAQGSAGGATLYRTTDAGGTWSQVGVMPNATGLALAGGFWGRYAGVGENNLEFANAQHGWLATGAVAKPGDSGLMETTDGGRTWHSVTIQAPAATAGQDIVIGYPILLSGEQALLPVFFGRQTDPNNFSVSHHYIYSSSDGGSTWNNPRPLEANGVQPTGDEWQNFYLDANHWWFTAINQRSAGEPVAQSGPAVARTSDGGKTWQLFKSKDIPTILQMTFTDADHGWAEAITGPTNTNILLRTTDGGAHWHQVQVP
ncbi:MAG TPA: hypothetical protein VGR77_03540 [Candidatus Dormibacteraeota bacterium]|nr:hypothetical protein [Candidatus Dormibacteraeota bacterium]